LLRIGGVVSGIVLVAFGVAVIVLAVWGQHTVTTELKRQKMTGTPDMTSSATRQALDEAGLTDVSVPSCDVAGKPINNGTRARCFAQYMNVHALEATGGYVYSEMAGSPPSRTLRSRSSRRAAGRTIRSSPRSIQRPSSR
jgi:hypothetical protein